jgi:hypothetical protein
MATKYFINGGVNNNYTDNTNWSTTSGGANDTTAPTSSDDVRLDGASPNCVLNATGNALTFDCTGFTGTLSGSSNLTVSGNVTFVAGMTITATGTLTVNATATLTSNGKTWTGSLTLPTALSTTTFADDWYIIGTLSASNTTLEGGKTISVEGNVTTPVNNGIPSSFCTIKFVNNGAQTLSTLGAIRANILIDKSGGSLTMLDASASGIRMYGDSFVVAGTNAGTITASNLISFNVATTIDASPINWNDITFVAAGAHTLSSALNVYGTLKYTTAVILNGSDTNIYGSFDYASTGNGTGTSNFYFLGTVAGTWVHSNNGAIRNNITINKGVGTLTIGANIRFNTGTLIYTSGTVDTTSNSSTLTIAASTTLNTNGIAWNNVTLSGGTTITFLSDLTCVNFTSTTNSRILLGSTLYISGNFTNNGDMTSGCTTTIVMNGTGIYSGFGRMATPLVFNTAGTITISGSVRVFIGGSYIYTSGTINASGSTLTLESNTTLNTGGMSWDNIVVSTATTLTLNSLLSVSGTFTLPNYNFTFLGTSGFSVANLTNATLSISRTWTFVSGVTYTITNSFVSTANTTTNRPTFRSSIAASQAILTLQAGASQNLKFVNATDINSSLGQQINSNKGTLSNATNWYRTNGTFMYLMQL